MDGTVFGAGRSLRVPAGAVAVVLALSAGCAPSCGCEGTAPAASEAAPQPSAANQAGAGSAAPPGATTAGPQGATANTAAAAVAQDPATGPTEVPVTAALSAFQQVFPDAPQGKALERLGVVQQRLSVAASPSSATLAPRATLTALLPNALAGFAAAQPIEDAPDRAGDVAVRIVSRAYKAGAREAFVRVIDAAQAPSFRTPLVEQLVQVGGEHQGFAHGRLVGGYPVVAVYFQKTQSSRATAIIGRRYLIDIRVSHAKSPYDAQEILAAMGVSRLAPPDDAGVAR